MEKLAGDIIILHMCTKNHNHMRYDSWDTVWGRRRFLSFWAIFCPFTTPPPLTTWKIKILKKWKKHLERSSWSYDVWFLRYKVRQTEAFVILGHFLPFDLTNNLKNQNFEKKKKKQKNMEILSFYTCVPQMMIIDVWFLRYWAQQTEFLSFWAMFCPFTPLTIWKIKILTKWKKSLEISFYTSVPKIMIIFYTVPEIWCVAGVFPKTPQN